MNLKLSNNKNSKKCLYGKSTNIYTISAILLIVSVTTIYSCMNNQVEKNVKLMMEEIIHIPYDKMDKKVCSMPTDTSSYNRTYRVVYYIEDFSCASCEIKQMSLYDAMYQEHDEIRDVEIIFILDVSPKTADETYRQLCNSRIKGTVYFDTCNAFKESNTHIPKEKMYHTFVLNKKDSVLLVGNPLKNGKTF